MLRTRLTAAAAFCFSALLNVPSYAAADPCVAPGTSVVTDATGDQNGSQAPANPVFDSASFDIRSVSVAEPVVGGVQRLVITLKVGSLPMLPPNGYWTVFFTNGAIEYFVSMQNTIDGGLAYTYGHTEVIGQTTNQVTDGDLLAESGYGADGTITLVANASVFGAVASSELTTISANTQQLVGTDFTGGGLLNYDTAESTDSFTLSGSCGTLGGGGTITVRAADSRDPSFSIYPTTATIQSDLFGAGEPTLDVNYATGSVFLRFILGTAKAVFTDTPTETTVAWTDVTDSINGLLSIPGLDPFLGGSYIPVAAGAGVDPLLVGTPDTSVPSRIFTMQLLAGTSAMSYSDDDGVNWDVAQGGGEPAGADNQSLAAGPYPEDFLLGPVVMSDYAVYYCSHSSVNAFCSRSDDGGMTFKNSFPIFPVDGLCGNHGHVKVGPDGTVYVPMNNSCLGTEGVTISTDGGITWNYVSVPETAGGRWDSSIAIARDGETVYYAYAERGPGGASSKDEPMVIKGQLIKGPTPTIQWDERGAANVGTPANLKNIVFSTMVAGDADRAAMIFHGTTTPGDSGAPAAMAGAVWHLYAATTLDGGASWALRNITPNDPTQKGAICDDGTTCTGNTRNLLDFMDAVVDGQGRIVVAFADGCTGSCITGAANNTDYGTLARQSGGPRLYAAFDPLPAAPVVAPPTAGDAQVTLDWSDVATATSYKVFQGTTSNGQGATPVKTVTASTAVVNTGLVNGTTYYFTVKAVNARGDSVASNEVSATPSAGVAALTASLSANYGSATPNAQGQYDVSGGPLMVTFNVATTGGDTSLKRYYMNFGDGTDEGPKNTPTFVHTYGNGGTQRAVATVTQTRDETVFSATSNTVTTVTYHSVVVTPGDGTPADARLTATSTNNFVAPTGVRFTTTGSKGLSYVLDFGDGDSATTPSRISGTGTPPATVDHIYNVPGTYQAKLTMTGDQTPTSDDVTIPVTVVASRQLTAQLSVSPSTVVAGNTATPVTMDASATVPDNGKSRSDYSYRFNFGDGTTVGPDETGGFSASHVYTAAGTYTLTLTVTEMASGKPGASSKPGDSSVVTALAQVNPLQGSNETVRDPETQRFVTVSTAQGTVTELQAVPTPAIAVVADEASRYPVGFVSYNVTDLPPSGRVTITITLPNGVNADGYLKCTVRECSQMPVTVNGNLLSFTLEDGGIGDEDGVKNGVIRDPGAPTFKGTPIASSGNPTATAQRSGGALNLWMLLPMLMAALRRGRRFKD